ncbi:MAG: type II toxin-antitoxin system RelE/ParE family toxin [Gammaproteobacteria bacterium]|nr:type II toxin-antitoxin system RelE/ParE family toxin [Gammaproteobacteria bacterium]
MFSRKAETDLESIGDYIAGDNPRRALSFVRELRKRCKSIGDFPENNPRFRELGPDARFCPHRDYIILYRVLDQSVSIERVLHGARDIFR